MRQRRHVGARHVRHGRTGLLEHAVIEGGAGPVDHGVHDASGDDLPVQPVVAQPAGEPLTRRPRKIGGQLVLHVGVVRKAGREDLVDVRRLGVREQHRELGGGEPDPRGLAIGHLLVGRQVLELAIDETFCFEGTQVTGVHVDHRGGLHAGHGQHDRLATVVFQYQIGHVVGHADEKAIALVDVHVAGRNCGVEKDLDVDLVIGAVDTRRVVDRVGVHESTVEGVFDATRVGSDQGCRPPPPPGSAGRRR